MCVPYQRYNQKQTGLVHAAAAVPSEFIRVAVDCAIILFILIHLQVFVSIPVKLNGGPVPGLGIVWLVGSALGLTLAFANFWLTAKTVVAMFPYVALCVWAFVSSSWSDNPADTLRGATFMTCSLIGACAIAALRTWEEILARLTLSLGGLMFISVFLAIFVPSLGQMDDILEGAWSGVWGEKQAMGMYAALLILATFCLVLANPRYWTSLALVPLGMIAIVGTTGKTAILMSLAGVCVLGVGWLIQRGPRIAMAALWGSIVSGSAVVYGLTQGKEEVFRLLGRTPDFTGRTEVWREVDYVANKKPMTGYGFHSVWDDQTSVAAPYQWIAEGTGFFPQNAHSSWLDVMLQLGVPGLFLLITCMGFGWLAAIIRLRTGGPGALFALSSLATLTLISFTESILVSSMDMPWLLVMLVTAKSVQELLLPSSMHMLSRPTTRHQPRPAETIFYRQETR